MELTPRQAQILAAAWGVEYEVVDALREYDCGVLEGRDDDEAWQEHIEVRREWFEGKQAVGVTAGASAPEILVKKVVEQLRAWGGRAAEEVAGRPEKVVFSLPRELRRA